MKYYYNHRVEAEYMALFHGMCFEVSGNDPRGYMAAICLNQDGPWVIREDSLHLLEPVVGDIVQRKWGDDYPIKERDPEILTIHLHDDRIFKHNTKDWASLGVSIIQRNGIAFMWPEIN